MGLVMVRPVSLSTATTPSRAAPRIATATATLTECRTAGIPAWMSTRTATAHLPLRRPAVPVRTATMTWRPAQTIARPTSTRTACRIALTRASTRTGMDTGWLEAQGDSCLGSDCDDTAAACIDNCGVDTDGDDIDDCADPCLDLDGDGYGQPGGSADACAGRDCSDTVFTCNVDCVTDVDADGMADCADTCIDMDGDGYGTGGAAGNTCVAEDCDDGYAACTEDCAGGCGCTAAGQFSLWPWHRRPAAAGFRGNPTLSWRTSSSALLVVTS